MITNIKDKIVSYHIEKPVEFSPELMAEHVQRPAKITGTTYKLKPPGSEDAMYITINNITLNSGTKHEETRPFEIFINSKNMNNLQWVLALSRVISAIFRKGGDYSFLIEELKSIFDPSGGYWDVLEGKSKYVPSIIAGIGYILEEHLNSLYFVPLLSKVLEVEPVPAEVTKPPQDSAGYKNASLCSKCSTKAVVMMDGCPTCLECGDSKCG